MCHYFLDYTTFMSELLDIIFPVPLYGFLCSDINSQKDRVKERKNERQGESEKERERKRARNIKKDRDRETKRY